VLFKSQARIQLKSEAELDAMRAAGRLSAECLEWIVKQIRPGMTTQDVDDLQVQFARRHQVRAAPLNYKGFPKSICTSINEVVCHGIPSRKATLREGDIVGVDVTLVVDGFHGDNAATVPVGEVSPSAMRLLEATLEANHRGIAAVAPEARLGDIGHAIQSCTEPLGYSVVRDFVGHGIGREFHCEPQVPHYGRSGRGLRLKAGMTFTVEPMINEGSYEVALLDDGWTAVTSDGRLSAQFEHTIAVTADGVEVLTVQNGEGAWEPPGRWYPPALAPSEAAPGRTG